MSLVRDNLTIDWRTKFWKKISKKIEYEYEKSYEKIKAKTINSSLTDLQKKQIIKEAKQYLTDSESEEKLSDVLKPFGL
jgi:DNA-binding ferritin-like protein (Dps family)